ARDVVIVAILPAPHDAACLIFPAGQRLELDLDEAVGDCNVAQNAPWEIAAAALEQRVGSGWCARLGFDAPLRPSFAGDALDPCRGQCADGVGVELDRFSHRDASPCQQNSQRRDRPRRLIAHVGPPKTTNECRAPPKPQGVKALQWTDEFNGAHARRVTLGRTWTGHPSWREKSRGACNSPRREYDKQRRRATPAASTTVGVHQRGISKTADF